MSMCIHSGEFETCQFGCTLRKPEELRLALDTANEENERLRKLLERYGEHSQECQDVSEQVYIEGGEPECICGLAIALKEQPLSPE